MPPSSVVRIAARQGPSRRRVQAEAFDEGPAAPRSGSGVFRILFISLLLSSGAVFFINGTQMVLRQSRVSLERERELEKCQQRLDESSASFESKIEQAGREKQRIVLQSRTANASCAVMRESLETCRKEGDKCMADLAGMAVTMAELQGQSQKDEEKAARCSRQLRKAESDLSLCKSKVDKLSGARTKVFPGNEDLLHMEHQEVVDEVQKLREKVSSLEQEVKSQAQALNESQASAKAEDTEAHSRNKQLLAQVKRLEADNAQLAEKGKQQEKESIQLEEEKAKLEEKARQLEEDKAQLQTQLDEGKVQAQKLFDEDKVKLQKQLDEDKIQLEQKAKELEERSADLDEAGQENSERVKLLEEKLDKVEPVADANTTGYKCHASEEDMAAYLKYPVDGDCPDDWEHVQRLIFRKDCFALPRRRCRTLTPLEPQEPLPRPQALFAQDALLDGNVRWQQHSCKSFQCLNTRKVGECLNCFNMTVEAKRWTRPFRGTIPMADVLAMKNGTLRIGLDVGGGTGAFAAHMAEHGVQVMTTAFDGEVVKGKTQGIPFMETIALRGLIPLHLPNQARLPFFDGTLDVVHSVNGIKFIEPQNFQVLLYEWDRVLRVGGILWFELFQNSAKKMPDYVTIIEGLGYKKLYWNFTPQKAKVGEEPGKYLYLNCVLEKTPHPGVEAGDSETSRTSESS